ncbi:hypothetical protein ONE63_010991 [Megalurothrips usitatus]|uniref:Fukutin n=1 Tax=Megalurothrips usitatus TaxID=439358 RepID=A0AAV7XHM9_9NEOP|nr:hypothetical protein ONE63_010991 [Megalurothrips usitatus]
MGAQNVDIAIMKSLTKRKLLLISSVFLVAEFLFFSYLAFSGENAKTPSGRATRAFDDPGKHLNISVSEAFLQEGKVLDRLFRDEGCRPFVVSPKILAHIWNVERKIVDCVGGGADCILDGDDVFLAIDSSCLPLMKAPLEDFVRKLKNKGFSISPTQSRKILGLPPKSATFLTSLILRKKYAFLVVVLHGREDNFWWHGSVYDDPNSLKHLAKANLLPANLVFMHNEGVIPKFELVETQLLQYTFLVPKDIPAFLRTSTGSASHFIECNYTQADEFFKTHGRDRSDEAKRFKHQAWKLLSRAKRILEDLEVPFWLSSGTCLGYLRQCDFIPYSQDVDLGVFASDFKEEIVPSFLSHGFKLHHTFGKPNDSYQIAFEYKGIKLDIFFFYLDNENGIIWNGGTEARSGRKFKYTFMAFSLCWTEFLDLLVRIPCNTKRYIEANYGQNWFTPVIKWSWKSSPPNVRRNGVWPKAEWSEVINIQ